MKDEKDIKFKMELQKLSDYKLNLLNFFVEIK